MGKPLRLLIVEDSEDDTLLIMREFKRGGYEPIFERVDKAEAMELALDKGNWDAIIADFSMPHFDGVTAFNLVKEKNIDLPFIFVSGSIGEETAVQAMKLGVHDYIMKNNLTRLVPAIERELREADVRRKRKEAEEALIEAKNFAESLISSAMDGIVVSDFEGNLIQFNDAFTRMLGFSAEELKNMNLRQLTPEKWLTEDSARFKGLLLEGSSTTNYDKELVRKGGSVFPINLSISLLTDKKSEPNALIAIVRDITERKQAEDKLRKTMGELKRSNEELEQFAYVASHDLQEPLRMVASYTQLLAERYKDRIDSDANDFIQYAVEGARRMQELINGLLAYSRVSTRGTEFEPTNCEAIIDEAVKNLQLMIDESGATITYDHLPRVMADNVQMIQLFQNLISNAIKFRSKEPPHIHIKAKKVKNSKLPLPKSESSNQESKSWLFSVQDNGIGIDPEFKDRIFTIFQRLHPREKYPGIGIGLTICKRIVNRHGGIIWVESKPGKGSTFYFTIPIMGEG